MITLTLKRKRKLLFHKAKTEKCMKNTEAAGDYFFKAPAKLK
jgi:hypothetical protein